MIASSLINYFIISSVCLLAFYLFYIIALKRQQYFNINRVYLLVSSALALIIPLIEIPVSSQAVTMPLQWEGYILLPPVEAEAAAAKRLILPSWQDLLLWIYGAGCTVSMCIMGSQLYRIFVFIKRNRAHILPGKGYYLIPTHGKWATSSFFTFLFWNEQAAVTQEEKKQILAHEEVHIAEKHSYDVLYFSLLQVFFWFHPAAYGYRQEITELHEFIADARVVSSHNLQSYQHILAKQAVLTENLTLANHFYKSHILKRIKMMERNQQKSYPYRIFIALPLLAMIFYVFSCKEENEMARLDALSQQYKDAKTDEEKAALADADEVFMVVENQPEPEGGMEAFYHYIRDNLTYPAKARMQGIEGKVFVQFVVNTDGSLSDVEVIKGIDSDCNAEALKVVQHSPAWNPGLQRGRAVRVRMVLPITFSLEGGQAAARADNLQLSQDKMQVHYSKTGDVVIGSVTAPDGKNLAGVNIIVKGTTMGTVSDMNGRFSITLPSGSDTPELVFSSIGFETRSVAL